MKTYNTQLETVRAVLKGKIQGFEKGILNIMEMDISSEAKDLTIGKIEFALRELRETLEQLEYFDEKDEEDEN